MLTPISLLIGLFIGFLSLAIPVTGALLLRLSAHRPKRVERAERVHERPNQVRDRALERRAHTSEHVRLLRWRERWREPAVLVPLLTGVFLLLLPLGFGRGPVQYAFPAGAGEPHAFQGAVQELTRPDGTKIDVEVFGSDNSPQLVLTHGWGT